MTIAFFFAGFYLAFVLRIPRALPCFKGLNWFALALAILPSGSHPLEKVPQKIRPGMTRAQAEEILSQASAHSAEEGGGFVTYRDQATP